MFQNVIVKTPCRNILDGITSAPELADDALKAWLEQQGIHTTAYWAQSPLADTSACPQAAYIYDHVLSLPCDQRYTPTDMERIAQAVRAFPLSGT